MSAISEPSAPKWRITICSPDNTKFIWGSDVETWREIKELATEARSQNLSNKIWIADPYGAVSEWV
jgi:hypothetical protein